MSVLPIEVMSIPEAIFSGRTCYHLGYYLKTIGAVGKCRIVFHLDIAHTTLRSGIHIKPTLE